MNFTSQIRYNPATVKDCKEQPIKLQEVHTEGGDYYLKIDSPAKALKEESMNRNFRRHFEDGLTAISSSLTKKSGTKKYEAVLKRIGKLEGKYPSIARYYTIDVAVLFFAKSSSIIYEQPVKTKRWQLIERDVLPVTIFLFMS